MRLCLPIAVHTPCIAIVALPPASWRLHAASIDSPASKNTPPDDTSTPPTHRKHGGKKKERGSTWSPAKRTQFRVNKQLFAANNQARIGAILTEQGSLFDADNIAVAMHCLGHHRRCGTHRSTNNNNNSRLRRADEPTVREALQLVETNINSFQPHQLAVCIWALARMHRTQQPLLDTLITRLTPQLHMLRAQQLCKVLWALASLRHSPGAAWLDAAAKQCLGHVNDLDAQGISTVMRTTSRTLRWAMAKLDHCHPALLTALIARADSECSTMTPQGLSNMVWALATLQVQVDSALLMEVEAAAVGSLQQSSPQSIANTLWGLVTLDYEPMALLRSMSDAPDAYLTHATPHDVNHVLLACARCQAYNADLVSWVLQCALRRWDDQSAVSPIDVAGIVHSLGKLEACPPQHAGPLAACLQRVVPQLRGRALATVVWGVARLSVVVDWDPALLGDILKRTRSMSFDKPQHAANVAWAAATLRHSRSPATVAAALAGVQPLLDDCKPKELCIILWSCALHNVGRAAIPAGRGASADQALLVDDAGQERKALESRVAQVLSTAWDRFCIDPRAFNEQDVSLLLWSQARLRHGALPAVDWPQMAAWLLDHVGAMEPRQLGMVAWAASRLPDAVEDAPRLFKTLEQQALSTMDEFSPMDLANFVHACGRVRYFPSPSTLDVLAQQVTARFDSFLMEELANALWGFAALNHHPGPLVGLVAAKEPAKGWHHKTLTWCFSVFRFSAA